MTAAFIRVMLNTVVARMAFGSSIRGERRAQAPLGRAQLSRRGGDHGWRYLLYLRLSKVYKCRARTCNQPIQATTVFSITRVMLNTVVARMAFGSSVRGKCRAQARKVRVQLSRGGWAHVRLAEFITFW